MVPWVKGIIFTDSNHGGDKVTSKSKTGVMVFVGANLLKSISKMQKTVADSTKNAEMVALRAACDEAKDLMYTLRSLGVRVQLPIQIFSDSKAAVDNVTIPGSPLRKKQESIIYHKCREGIALELWEIYFLDGDENSSDINTKVTARDVLNKHTGHVMCGQGLR